MKSPLFKSYLHYSHFSPLFNNQERGGVSARLTASEDLLYACAYTTIETYAVKPAEPPDNSLLLFSIVLIVFNWAGSRTVWVTDPFCPLF